MQVYNTSAVILMATGGASGGGYTCSQGLLFGIYCTLLIMHGLVNSFGCEFPTNLEEFPAWSRE